MSASLGTGVTGLVAPNGRGKSLLLELLAGRRRPSTGSIEWTCASHHVGQFARLCGPRVAEALDAAELHDCFARIERGDGSPQDLARVDGAWALPAQWRACLDDAGLAVSMDTPVSALSEGQRTRLALAGAFLRADRYLLLDEPTNHLDGPGREWLVARLQQHASGALIASHDRAVLNRVDEILELGAEGLRRYGGSFELYDTVREAERDAVRRHIEGLEKDLRREQRQQQASLQRAARRRKQGEKLRRSGSQSKLLLDAKAQRAQATQSKMRRAHEQRARRITQALEGHKSGCEEQRAQRLVLATHGSSAAMRLHLHELRLPRVEHPAICATLYAGERWRVHGANGCGKSTLLQVIEGRLKPAGGECRRSGSCVYLDQEFSVLDPQRCAVDNLRRLHPGIAEVEWRTRLGSVRLEGDQALLPVAALSGGERLKVALLAVTGAQTAPDLLLLDEPDNHLDLGSRELLEAALRRYSGTLLVVSHDETFIDRIGVDHTLALASPTGVK